jgi:hypothetical protein
VVYDSVMTFLTIKMGVIVFKLQEVHAPFTVDCSPTSCSHVWYLS